MYGVLGWTVDRAFTTITRSRRQRRVVPPTAQPELIPIYALAVLLFEPAHDALRQRPVVARAAAYAAAFTATEYAIGRVLHAFGHEMWNYSGARWSVHGLTRLDYAPLWAVAGLALERMHDGMSA